MPDSDSWDNEVWVYDFGQNQLSRRSSRKVFARDGLNDGAVEARLAKLIESPLARFAHGDTRHRSGTVRASDQRTIDDPDVLRAVALVFVVQGARGLDGTGTTTDSLSTLMSMSDEKLSAYAGVFWSRNRVGTFRVPPNVSLFLPETGWYPFPVFDATRGPVWGMALPLNPRTALFTLPSGVGLDNTATNTAFVANFSIGMGSINARVVVSTDLVDTYDAATLEAQLPLMRAEMEAKRDYVEKARALVADMHRAAGLAPPQSKA